MCVLKTSLSLSNDENFGQTKVDIMIYSGLQDIVQSSFISGTQHTFIPLNMTSSIKIRLTVKQKVHSWEKPAYLGAKSVFLDQPFLYIYIHKLFLKCAENETSVDVHKLQKVQALFRYVLFVPPKPGFLR